MPAHYSILFFCLFFIASCKSISSGKYYLNEFGGDVFNEVLILGDDHTYFYVERLRDNRMNASRVYNAGVYKYNRTQRRLYLTSFNRLNNGIPVSLMCDFDSILKDTIKLRFKNINTLLTNANIKRIPWRLHIDDEIMSWEFGMPEEFIAPNSILKNRGKYLNIEIGGVMSERLYFGDSKCNVFIFTFNDTLPSIDSTKNIYNSFFDQREFYLVSKNKIKEKSGYILTKNKCKVCDTSSKFRYKFLLNLKLENCNLDTLKWLPIQD